MAPVASCCSWCVVWLQESFLLGGRSLIPLSGSWWDESFEVCWSRPELSCWYDVLALPRVGRRSGESVVVFSFAACGRFMECFRRGVGSGEPLFHEPFFCKPSQKSDRPWLPDFRRCACLHVGGGLLIFRRLETKGAASALGGQRESEGPEQKHLRR